MDTVVSLSILPLSNVNRIMIDPMPVPLMTANRNKIKCYGQANMEIRIPTLRRTFIIANVINALLRSLSHYKWL